MIQLNMYKYSQFFIKLFELFFPEKCSVCNKNISYLENSICAVCKNEIFMLDKNRCLVCSGKIIRSKCSICSNRYIYFDKNISIFLYTDIIKLMIHSFKFKSNLRIGQYFSNIIAIKIKEMGVDVDYITAVPMTKKRKQKRGYNQAEVIAKKVAKIINLEYKKLLIEHEKITAQKTLTYNERFLNALDRYAPKKKIDIGDKNIIIIDDVFTTGATINECSRILKKMGARQVFSLTIAFVDIEID